MAKTSKQLKIDGTNVEAKKGENAMTTSFNIWEFTKQQLCEQYLKDKENITVKVRFMDDYKNEEKGINIEGARKVFNYLTQNGAIEDYEVTEKVELIGDALKRVFYVKVVNLNPQATAKSKKTGKTFPLFRGAMGRALEKEMFTKATA